MGPYVDGFGTSRKFNVTWFNKGDDGGTMQVWHGDDPMGRKSAVAQLGYRTNFSRNLEQMIENQVTQLIYVSESSRNHTVFVFDDNEHYTYAKLIYDGRDIQKLVNDFISEYIMKEMNSARIGS